jgi:c-di-GMP-binding flagellar brake protein YcgR
MNNALQDRELYVEKNTVNSNKKTNNTQQNVWYLERIVCCNNGKKWFTEISHFPFYIGRKENCELCLQSKYVSKYHAVIVRENNLLKITDLNSVNGVYINHKLINKSTFLEAGDIIHFSNLFNNKVGFRLTYKQKNNSCIKSKPTNMSINKVSHSVKRSKSVIEGRDYNFSIGTVLYLDFKKRHVNHIKAHLFAHDKEKYLIASIPQSEEIQIKKDDLCTVRFFHDSKVLSLSTKVLKIEDISSQHIYLEYPKNITYVSYRRHERYCTNLRGFVRKSIHSRQIPCKVIDISLGGCKVSFKSDVNIDFEGEMSLTFEHLINDIRVVKVHDKKTEDSYDVGFKIISFGGKAKNVKYQEILDFHAPQQNKL